MALFIHTMASGDVSIPTLRVITCNVCDRSPLDIMKNLGSYSFAEVIYVKENRNSSISQWLLHITLILTGSHGM
jgi:hypothetical protein